MKPLALLTPLALAGLICAAEPARAQSGALFAEPVAARLDAAIDQAMRHDGLPSVAVGVWVPGHGAYRHVAGIADIVTGAPRRWDQPFRIGGITKSFTATAVLTVIDHNQLHKTDRLAQWLPDFPHAADISIDDLLRMRAGIAEPTETEALQRVYDQPTIAAPPVLQRIGDAANLAGQFRPAGSAGVPSLLSFILLGVIVQNITNQDLPRFLSENVLTELDLHATSFPTGTELPGGLHGYGVNAETGVMEDKTALNPALTDAAGAMISTIADLETYVIAVCTGQISKLGTHNARMKGQMLADGTTMYSEGLVVGGGLCGHSGTAPGFSTDMYYVPASGAAVVVNVNRLDRDQVSRSAPILKIVLDTLQTSPAVP